MTNEKYELIFAIDPSEDNTEELIRSSANLNSRIRGIVFSRRIGQPAATLAGLEHAKGETVVVMDVDLQDPPELIPKLYDEWKKGYKVVVARRRNREGETFLKRGVAKVGYAVIERLSDVPIPRDAGDFRLLDQRIVKELLKFPESHGFLRGIVALVGFEQSVVEFDRPARYSGSGNYNRYLGSLRIGMNGVIGFSTALLNLSTILGLLTATMSGALGVLYVVMKFLGFPFPLGNPTVVTLVLFMGGVQLICLGIMGQYIGRIYEESKRRPRYIVNRMIQSSKDE